ncbi:MAG TPA: thiamine-phosphate kinase, partial [Alphaproteobacteria bacterium]|nr:thiamine-phosphate kinase [Alphaproteobacteria bacterium]
LSDLAAKGARPIVYTLALILPDSLEYAWLERFAEGLKTDQDEFGIILAGGDTDATPGPLTLSLTAVGAIPARQRLLRSAAEAGDAVFVSGTIGDAALGLKAIRGELRGIKQSELDFLKERYRLPRPRLALGRRLRGLAHATMDISDGLVGDLAHICEASGVAARVDAASVPLSPGTRAALACDGSLIESVLAGGDDYELLFTAPPEAEAALIALARELALPLTRVGAIEGGHGVRVLDGAGREIALARTGYRHF